MQQLMLEHLFQTWNKSDIKNGVTLSPVCVIQEYFFEKKYVGTAFMWFWKGQETALLVYIKVFVIQQYLEEKKCFKKLFCK